MILMQQLLIAQAAAAAASGWNSADKSASITLSGGGLVATTSTSGAQGVRSITGHDSGEWYAELTLTSSAAEASIGFSKAATSVATCGGAANQWGYYGPTGQKYSGGALSAYGATYTTGVVLGFYYNAGSMTMYKNNVSQGVIASGITGLVYLHFSTALAAAPGLVGTVNVGGSAFTYTPPGSATAWG